MARSRTVKPDVGKHADLYDAEVETGLPLRFAWVMLWTVTDREGRFPWKPRELKPDVLPHDDVDFAQVLDAFERYGFVRSYVVAGKKYGVIPTFKDHQTFHRREAASKLPAPPDMPTVEGPSKDQPRPVQGQEASGPRSPVSVSVSVSDGDDETPARGKREPSEKAPKKQAKWLPQFQAAWRQRFHGELPGGRTVKALRKLCEEPNDPGEVLRRWVIYLDAHEGKGQFASAETFARTYGQWAQAPPVAAQNGRNGAIGGVGNRTFANAVEALRDE